MINLVLEKPDSIAEKTSHKWGRRQIGVFRFWLLQLCVVCQAVTVLMTWSLWQVRTDPPLLPVIDMPFQFPFGILMLVSLLYVLLDPKRGLYIHLGLMIAACFFDQMRTQPQFLAIWVMMFATVSDIGMVVARWFLPTMWFWAGLHKILSPDWLGMQSWSLVERAGGEGDSYYLAFAIVVAMGEMAAGLAGIFRPRLGAWICPALHFGIMIFLSPLFINWNFSVLPWNFCTGIVGAWVLWNASSILPKTNWERIVAAAFLILPIGFYFGVMDHGYSNVLYSDSLPKAVITTAEGPYEVIGWGKLRVPFPNERRLLKDNFRRGSSVGDKMHLYDPRPSLPDQYFKLAADGELVEISEQEFFSEAEGELRGVSYDCERSIFKLGFGGARLLKKEVGAAIYAIEFDPELFTPDLLDCLSGLTNLEQIQLAGCNIRDDDLKKIAGLRLLSGIGLNNTPITDAGLLHLKKLPKLHTVERENTNITDAGLARLFANERTD